MTGWKECDGKRYMDYPFYNTTVSPDVMDLVVETALRLKLNLIIPASFLDIDNPPEKALADCVAKRGIFLSQHHLEPLGLSHFTFENYCKKFQKDGQYSYIYNPETLLEVWKYYAEKWAEYENVIWQVGLRGKADRPVWEEDTPTEQELQLYADYISDAIRTQKEIVLRATNGKAQYFSTTLWMEGSTLMEKGLLDVDNDTMIVFADNGPNQMFGSDYDRVPRLENMQYGIYYHVQYFGIGPHLAPQTGLNKLYYNVKKAKEKGDDAYFILNVSNMREFDFELKAYAEMLWDFKKFSIEQYLEEFCKAYGDQFLQAKAFINTYFNQLPVLDTSYLQYVHANYFNYNYDEVTPSNVKNFIVKDGLILLRGSQYLIYYFKDELPDQELFEKMHAELTRVLPLYEELASSLESWLKRLNGRLKKHVQCKWWLYTQTLLHSYRWFISLYEAKISYNKNEIKQTHTLLHKACESLEEYLAIRKVAEYGNFENWYRGDLKMNVKQRLEDTKQLLKQISKQ